MEHILHVKIILFLTELLSLSEQLLIIVTHDLKSKVTEY